MPTLGYVGESAQAWGQAQVVVTATNALGALVEPMLLAPEAVVCDVSRPFNIPTDLATLRPDVTVIEGGIIAPHGEFDLGVDLGIGRRHCYACMAETMLLALEQAPDRGSVGASISPANLHWLRNVAARAGFRTVLDPAPEAQR